MGHSTVANEYCWGKELKILQKWETKQEFSFILMENWGPQMTDNLTKVTPEVCGRGGMLAAESQALLTLSSQIFRNLLGTLQTATFKKLS